MPGETIKIEAVVTDEGGSGIGSVYLRYVKPITQAMKLIHLSPEDGKYVAYFTISEFEEDGLWEIFSVTMTDGVGNMSYVYQTYSDNPLQPPIDLSSASFEVENANSDVTAPILLSINVDKPNYVPNETIRIEAEVTDNAGSGISSVYLRYKKPLTNTMKLIHLYPESGKYVANLVLSDADEEGVWEIFSVTLTDLVGNMSYVYQTSSDNPDQPWVDLTLASFEYKEPDVTPPIITVNIDDYALVPVGFNLSVSIEDDFQLADQSILLKDFSGMTAIGCDKILDEGVYELIVYAIDQAGNEATLVRNFVVYDNTSGFVTGGGWIDSPEGALSEFPLTQGKATFGFVSKYLKGANTPTGNTTFNFEVANFKFKSASYDWLVVAGKRAQFKGDGEVNGVSGYAFMLTAIDDQVDRFRIKIWEKDSGFVIYDNQSETSDLDDLNSLGTLVMEGSIKIHK